MRTPEEWVVQYSHLFGGKVLCTDAEAFAAAIQCDASRSAARSERERAARVCEEQVAASRAMGEPSGLAELCRNRIRSLTDVPA